MYTRLMGLALAAVFPLAVQPAGDMTRQDPIELKVLLGDEANAMRFQPDHLRLETGKLYKLVLHNPSKEAHYFSSEGLSGAVFTRKVQINGPDGKAIGEVKGTMREIEVYPRGTVEWWLVPVKAGLFGDLRCTIAGHQAMTGLIEIR